MSHNQALRVGQFSMQILGHFWVQINSLTIPRNHHLLRPNDIDEQVGPVEQVA